MTKRAARAALPPALLGASHAPARAPDHGFERDRAFLLLAPPAGSEAGAGHPAACVGGVEQRRASGRTRAARASLS